MMYKELNHDNNQVEWLQFQDQLVKKDTHYQKHYLQSREFHHPEMPIFTVNGEVYRKKFMIVYKIR